MVKPYRKMSESVRAQTVIDWSPQSCHLCTVLRFVFCQMNVAMIYISPVSFVSSSRRPEAWLRNLMVNFKTLRTFSHLVWLFDPNLIILPVLISFIDKDTCGLTQPRKRTHHQVPIINIHYLKFLRKDCRKSAMTMSTQVQLLNREHFAKPIRSHRNS